ncbi:hypothetical protein [Massilia endophytica]|uniref:hypothetical protein n=1 Tax=Massilia endophytica TaxID=2899220 RepID=UPI001E610455|nr:hypothetical protein [Massilia endophytica]UGQ47692.1 hypothetical protein LSQ66_04205 [Massilia endophytica]
MRTAFEAWAARDGHIVRRREDKPDEYLVYETQRRWVIWQAALEHGKTPARRTAAKSAVQRPATIGADEATVRTQVLNEVLDAFSGLQGNKGMEDIMNVIQGLKQKQQSQSAD